MGCQIHSLNTQVLYKNLNQQSTCFSVQQPNFYKHYRRTTVFSSVSTQQPTSTQQTQIPESILYNVKFKTLGACKLGISRYPDFEYNAEGGAGAGTATKFVGADDDSDGEVSVEFDVKTLYIPPLSAETTKFLGLPLPPFLRIDILPQVFEGIINQETGEIHLKFRAKFCFSVGSIYKAPPLLVETILTSEESKGDIRRGRGERLNKDGTCRLVGVATVQPIDDIFINIFLLLPTECLADLNATISLSSTTA